jgi:hypothetical protein
MLLLGIASQHHKIHARQFFALRLFYPLPEGNEPVGNENNLMGIGKSSG